MCCFWKKVNDKNINLRHVAKLTISNCISNDALYTLYLYTMHYVLNHVVYEFHKVILSYIFVSRTFTNPTPLTLTPLIAVDYLNERHKPVKINLNK